MSVFRSRDFAVVALLSFVAVAIFCVWAGAAMNAEDAMSDCTPYPNEAVLCGTNAQNHIAMWQNFLHVIPQKTFDLLLLALLLVFASAAYKTAWPCAPEVAQRFKAKEYSTLGIGNPIKRALARGIIQPQIYNPAIN